MSLGRNSGAALIGRQLDMTVQAVLDAQEDPANLCLEADVFYGDNRINRSSVRVSAERTGPTASDALIRIRSSTLIDEPVVSVQLRAGCVQKTERRYVVLSDLVSEPVSQSGSASSASTGFPVTAPTLGGVSGQQQPGVNGRPSRSQTGSSGRNNDSAGGIPGAAGTPNVAGSTSGGATASPARPARAPAVRQPVRPRPAAATTQAAAPSRLKLEPLDLSVERDPSLRASTEMLSTPTANEQERTVAAALWRALNAKPEDFQQNNEKLEALEKSIASLQAQTRNNQQAITDLNVQLEQARSERYANVFVYGLGLLLLLALAALFFVWRRKEKPESGELPWWRKNMSAEKGWSNSLDAASGPEGDARNAGGRKAAAKVSASMLDLDLGLDNSAYAEVKNLSSASSSGQDSMPPLSRRDRPDFGMSLAHMSRSVKAEELFDVQQQADFFISLGQHDQAIHVLRSHIGDNSETSALVFLDLFDLYHQLGRKDDYEQLRGEFGQLFNANVPAFEVYSDASAGIEAYEPALERIIALWPSVRVLDVIEESIFKKPEEGVPPFDLEAYRELLLLYTVAKEILGPDAIRDDDDLKYELDDSGYGSNSQGSRSRKFGATAIQPLSATMALDPHQDTTPVELSAFPRPSPRLGLDIDLTEMVGEPSAPDEPTVSLVADSDAKFFDQFVADIEGTGNDETRPSLLAPESKADKPATPDLTIDPGNLIDFDTFDSSGGLGDDKKRSRS